MEAIGVQVCSRPASRVSLRRLLPQAQWLRLRRRRREAACATRGRPGRACFSSPCRDAIATATISSPRRSPAARRPSSRSGRSPEFGLPNCVVADARDAYGRICQALAGNPSQRLKLIGVTGTNGKTTTSCLLASVLATARASGGVAGHAGLFRRRDMRAGRR